MMKGFLSVRNWNEFQHYKDRNPPWIKLHRDLLNNYDFTCLQDASKAHLVLIWLLASQLDNHIPNDPAWISKRIGCAQKLNLNTLIEKGFLVLDQGASNALAECTVETETDVFNNNYWKQKEIQKEWLAFKKMRQSIKAPVNKTAEIRIIAKLQALSAEGDDPAEVLNRSIENCWKGVFPLKDGRSGANKQSGGSGLPRNDASLQAWAKTHGYREARPGESFPEYRSHLETAVKDRLNEVRA